jgi:hypothetical protein
MERLGNERECEFCFIQLIIAPHNFFPDPDLRNDLSPVLLHRSYSLHHPARTYPLMNSSGTGSVGPLSHDQPCSIQQWASQVYLRWDFTRESHMPF